MKLTRRGERFLAVAVLVICLAFVLGIYKAATSIHWTDSGYCFGSFEKCYKLEGEGNK